MAHKKNGKSRTNQTATLQQKSDANIRQQSSSVETRQPQKL